MEFTRARIGFARDLARKYLRQHRIVEAPVPVEYLLVAERVSVHLVEYEGDTSGEAWWEGEVGHVAVAKSLARPRLRFTLAHEFGHLALRHHQRRFGDLSSIDQVLRDPGSLAWEGSDPLEMEANAFAAELLLPAALFMAAWKATPVVGRVAARFEVSREAVQWRVKGLGLG
jgi:Zn-dependent peptidase ImmA (M78 family)